MDLTEKWTTNHRWLGWESREPSQGSLAQLRPLSQTWSQEAASGGPEEEAGRHSGPSTKPHFIACFLSINGTNIYILENLESIKRLKHVYKLKPHPSVLASTPFKLSSLSLMYAHFLLPLGIHAPSRSFCITVIGLFAHHAHPSLHRV